MNRYTPVLTGLTSETAKLVSPSPVYPRTYGANCIALGTVTDR